MKKISSIAVAALMGITALAGCSGGGADSSKEPATLTNITGTWSLSAGEGPDGNVTTKEPGLIELVVEPDGTFSGTSGCNTIMGQLTAEDGAVTMGAIGMTRMACEQPLMDLEQRYIIALEAVSKGHLKDGKLILSGVKTELIYVQD